MLKYYYTPFFLDSFNVAIYQDNFQLHETQFS